MEEIRKVSDTLYNVVIGNTNTKVGIKTGVRELKRKMERIKVRMEDYE